MRVAAAAAIAGLGLGVVSGHEGFHVVSPTEGSIVTADRTYTVEWTGSFDNSRVKIDLCHCGSDCKEDECGDWVTSLCPYGERGCPDNEGDYDIVMPHPMAGTSESTYKVRVVDADDDTNWSCSGGFTLVAADDVVVDDEDADRQPGMTVISPRDGDLAYAGNTYTVMFDYFNDVGSRKVGRFNIDLYEADGEDDCGTYVTTICDKPSIGCKDSSGDYDVVIPDHIPVGQYKIRVGAFENDSAYGCSGQFDVVSDMHEETDDVVDDKDSMENDADDDDMSFSFSYKF